MKNPVIIKSYPNGLSVYLDDSMAFEDLLQEVAVKFQETGHFFKDAAVVISIEGRELSDVEERAVVDTITMNSSLTILCIMGKDDEKNLKFMNVESKLQYTENENMGQFYRGTLRNGQSIETDKSIIILGDVYPGCSVYSSKDIVILGGLFGEAYAGATGEYDHYVAALEMSPERLRIGDLKYRPEKTPKWGIKPKMLPKIAYIQDLKIKIDPITKELLEHINS